MKFPRPLISFDWAIKRLLRQKANYSILEGFLSELFRFDVMIQNILESQSQQEDAADKYNCVDILCESADQELILVELQYNSENDYFHRMLYGTSKLICDHINLKDDYDKVKKVYSVNIVYFELGQGDDYVYYGKNEFKGIHTNTILQVNAKQREMYHKTEVHQIYPEYYIIRVNKFDDIAKDTLDEWIYYLKNNSLPEHYKAKGLQKVAEQLRVDNMTEQEKINYNAHCKELAIRSNEIETAVLEGFDKGVDVGFDKGISLGVEKTKLEGIKKALIRKKLTLEEIAEDFEVTLDFVLKTKADFNL